MRPPQTQRHLRSFRQRGQPLRRGGGANSRVFGNKPGRPRNVIMKRGSHRIIVSATWGWGTFGRHRLCSQNTVDINGSRESATLVMAHRQGATSARPPGKARPESPWGMPYPRGDALPRRDALPAGGHLTRRGTPYLQRGTLPAGPPAKVRWHGLHTHHHHAWPGLAWPTPPTSSSLKSHPKTPPKTLTHPRLRKEKLSSANLVSQAPPSRPETQKLQEGRAVKGDTVPPLMPVRARFDLIFLSASRHRVWSRGGPA